MTRCSYRPITLHIDPHPLSVRPKKHLGQHFLRDMGKAERIATALTGHGSYGHVVEVGPGTGVLTQYLLRDARFTLHCVEMDTESVEYLNEHYPQLSPRLHQGDFLRFDLQGVTKDPLAVIGNFPYNISSQIFFKVLDNRGAVTEVVGMVQKEVADRIACGPGSKTYGILSVLLQAFYDVELLFNVEPGAFNPPPKVRSSVLRLRRNAVEHLGCDEVLFFRVVKMAFNQRRKTLRNALSGLTFATTPDERLMTLRAEQLSVAEFVSLTRSASGS